MLLNGEMCVDFVTSFSVASYKLQYPFLIS
jgi:hypothetical protein